MSVSVSMSLSVSCILYPRWLTLITFHSFFFPHVISLLALLSWSPLPFLYMFRETYLARISPSCRGVIALFYLTRVMTLPPFPLQKGFMLLLARYGFYHVHTEQGRYIAKAGDLHTHTHTHTRLVGGIRGTPRSTRVRPYDAGPHRGVFRKGGQPVN